MNEPGSNPAPISPEDLALYAMQALPADEMAALAAALRNDPQARQELARLQSDLALVALSADQQPAPAGAIDRLKSRLPRRTPTGAQNAAVTAVDAGAVSEIGSAPRSRWKTVTPWAIAAALAIACSILGYRASSLNDALDGAVHQVAALSTQASHAQQVLEVLNAPDAQRVTLTATKTPPEPTAHTVYLADRGALVMEASHLKPVPAGKAYELWVIPASGAAPVPAGTFRPNAEGYASVVLPRIPSGVTAKAFGITIENEAGSSTPTPPIVLSGE